MFVVCFKAYHHIDQVRRVLDDAGLDVEKIVDVTDL